MRERWCGPLTLRVRLLHMAAGAADKHIAWQDEVSQALPGNVVLTQPVNTAPARDPTDALADWGGQWHGTKRSVGL